MQISYLRVSTARQGESGLGLEAQRAAVRGFLGAEPDAEFVEIESGKMANRPQLLAAMAECKRFKARLVVAKLDRLTRNLHFLTGLIDSKIDFVAVDNPHANKLTLHILGAVAESERDAISARTTAALAAARREGASLVVRLRATLLSISGVPGWWSWLAGSRNGMRRALCRSGQSLSAWR